MIKAICIILGNLLSAQECNNNLEMSKHLTVISSNDLKDVLQQAHIEVFNKPANQNKINMAWSQIAFENGRGKLVYNYNLGNIGVHATKYSKPYYKVASSRFRSFLSFKDGAKAYWKVLKNRCGGALSAFDQADVKLAATFLKNCGYYQADLDFYYINMNSLFVESRKY